MNKKIIWISISIILIISILALNFQSTIFKFFQSNNMNQTQLKSKTYSNGIQVEDITVGTGKAVSNGDNATFHYTGTLEDGKKFDSSLDRGLPFSTKIGVGQVIKGWDIGIVGIPEEGLESMKIGGKRKLTIPYTLAYGDGGIPGLIPAKATLIFEVELIDTTNQDKK
jgi:FKBP-type peptidyl-prolyl cis-trans isomerase